MQTIDGVLVANRGEIAVRIMRSVQALGWRTVAVYSEADANAPFVRAADEAVCLGAPEASASYLNVAAIVEAAKRSGAQAVHPGYGFLAENPAFAEACVEAGLVFVGPAAETMRLMGDKIAARQRMDAAGVPIVPGFHESGASDSVLLAQAEQVGFPLMVKAAAGGGGKGMRVIEDHSELAEALVSCRREAKSAFADDTVYLERFLPVARHIEVQIMGDAHGNVIHIGERECSLQRRHQKVVEETPAANLDAQVREAMLEAAVKAAQAVGYVGAGTVEFVLDPDGQFYFLEMNTRLQVEHPVTELVYGLDLVRMQLEVAAGQALSVGQDQVLGRGHAVEARVYAEDPSRDFAPQIGTVLRYGEPEREGVRCDSGIAAGSEVGVYYDPLLAKMVAWGEDRHVALARLERALADYVVLGVGTNKDWLRRVLRHEDVRAGEVTTRWLAQHTEAVAEDEGARRKDLEASSCIAAVWLSQVGASSRKVLPGVGPAFRSHGEVPERVGFTVGDDQVDVRYVATRAGGRSAADQYRLWVGDDDAPQEISVCACDPARGALVLVLDGIRRTFVCAQESDCVWVHRPCGVLRLGRVPRFVDPLRQAAALGGCIAAMPGKVVEVLVGVGAEVAKGQALVVLESMKMETKVCAATDGEVSQVCVEAGQTVDAGAVLVVLG